MSTIIGLKDLRENTQDVTDRVEQGESFVVVKRSKPIFKIVPMDATNTIDNELHAWTTEAINRYRPALETLKDH